MSPVFDTIDAAEINILSFDLNDGGSKTVTIINVAQNTCTVTETGTQGAAVSYACTPISETTCDGDQSVTFNFSGSARIDITNTFPEPEPEPEPAAAEPVEAAPTFTG